MGKEYYDRYQSFKVNGKYKPLPFIKIEPKNSDKAIVYHSQRTRMDKLSQQYYNNPYHGWLILLANPQYGGVEENIPDNEIIRIPFPFRESLQQYITGVNSYEALDGDKN
tara:strand:- start:320 stop:649 length:330 start_codon:yes stop_codon:yes gene_type:complete